MLVTGCAIVETGDQACGCGFGDFIYVFGGFCFCTCGFVTVFCVLDDTEIVQDVYGLYYGVYYC